MSPAEVEQTRRGLWVGVYQKTGSKEAAEAALRDFDAAFPTPAQPAGWKLVPLSPTKEMLAAVERHVKAQLQRLGVDRATLLSSSLLAAETRYCIMVDAAPPP